MKWQGDRKTSYTPSTRTSKILTLLNFGMLYYVKWYQAQDKII